MKLFAGLFWPTASLCRATEAVLWAEQCDDRAVLWEHLISSTRGAKQQRTVPWYLACAVSGKIATGPTLIAKMPPECVSATSPVPDHETTREDPSICVCVKHIHTHTKHQCASMCVNVWKSVWINMHLWVHGCGCAVLAPVSSTFANQYLCLESHQNTSRGWFHLNSIKHFWGCSGGVWKFLPPSRKRFELGEKMLFLPPELHQENIFKKPCCFSDST